MGDMDHLQPLPQEKAKHRSSESTLPYPYTSEPLYPSSQVTDIPSILGVVQSWVVKVAKSLRLDFDNQLLSFSWYWLWVSSQSFGFPPGNIVNTPVYRRQRLATVQSNLVNFSDNLTIYDQSMMNGGQEIIYLEIKEWKLNHRYIIYRQSMQEAV